MIFQYDSMGSFVLGALVERLTGMPLLDYLRSKCLDEIGFSKNARFLKCPGGHSWSDSTLLCTAQDLLKTARFVMNGGSWHGKRFLNSEYLRAATSRQIDNNVSGLNNYRTQGYGYQFWRTWHNSYFFTGIGCQFAVCVPDSDFILIYNGDNQGNPLAGSLIIDNFFALIAECVEAHSLPEDDNDALLLSEYSQKLQLTCARGSRNSPCRDQINGVWFLT